jgi:UDP-N-acetylmuramoylalanine--D-glutamate ligase
MDMMLDAPTMMVAEINERRSLDRSWKSMQVVIIGAARQGIALARYLTKHGAYVILTDRRSEDELDSTIKSLANLDIRWQLGGHPFSLLTHTDLICVSGGVPLDLPLLNEARVKDIGISNDSQIFLEAVHCRTVGITGSAGKTTTTTMLGEMARLSLDQYSLTLPYRKVWVGGNIGNPLISNLESIVEEDLAILELSSFQLEIMTISPNVSAILNITPNHLDRHGTMAAYTEAKAHILAYQHPDDIAVLNREDTGAWNFHGSVFGNLVTFGIERPDETTVGTFLQDGWVCFQENGISEKIIAVRDIPLRGMHNLYNVLAACAIGRVVGLPFEAMRRGITTFKGVPHRLEHVRSWGGAEWYNDSIATAPERTMAAIRSFDEPILLLAGGRDKDLPWEELAQIVVSRVRALILFGEVADKVERVIRTIPGSQELTLKRCDHLEDAVKTAAEMVIPGEVVLLSPGGTSFDEFKDFEERGECFRKLVMDL